VLRGAEGEAAQNCFSIFGDLIRSPDAEIRFSGRNRRPPLDPVNALLSFLYTLLTHDCRSAVEGVGLDPAVGFLHRDRPGRPSLALDLMEELRPILADRLALSLFNRRQLRGRDFETRDGGAVLLCDDGRSLKRKSDGIRFWKKRRRLASFLICRRNFWRDTGGGISTLIPPGSGSEARLASARSEEGSP
jgi:CRISPR-associated protein Cas1